MDLETKKRVQEAISSLPLSKHEQDMVTNGHIEVEPMDTKIFLQKVKEHCSMLIKAKLGAELTEAITLAFEKLNHLYTTRDDDKSEVWIYQEGIYVPQGKTYIKEFTRDILGDFFSKHVCNEIINKIETDTYIESEKFFNNIEIENVPVENGIINVLTKELQPFSPERIFFNKLPLKYDTEAKCPIIQQFFNDVVAKPEDVQVLQELFGFILYKDYKFEKAFMMTGSGRNGKGKMVELMKRFLGPDNVVNVTLKQLETDQYSIGYFLNKMANLGADIGNLVLKETDKFKNLTGHDLVTANRKYKTPIHFQNFAKMIFCANEIPDTIDKTFAFFNRWIIIDFPYTFLPKSEMTDDPMEKLQDTNIIDKLSCPNELSGLLNWSLAGLDRLMKNKYFSYSGKTEDIKIKWIRKSNSFSAFMMDCVENDYDCSITKNELRRVYTIYCKKHHLKPVSDTMLKSVLTKEYGSSDDRPTIDTQRIRVWSSIKFVQGVQDDHGLSRSIISFQFKSDLQETPGQDGHPGQKQMFSYMDRHKKNNAADINAIFGTEIVKKLKTEGVLFEVPAGTYKYVLPNAEEVNNA